MRITFMAQCYAPEDVSAAVLITELLTDLAQRGHQVTMVTCAPNYPYGRVYSGYRNQAYYTELLDGVRVVRTWSYISPSKTFWRRIAGYGSYSATALYGGFLASKPDVIVSFSPPLPLGVTAWLLARLWRVPWILQLEDIYPDAAVAAGLLHNHSAITFFSALERFEYRHADHISVISDSFQQNLAGKGVPAEKVTVIPVWADPAAINVLPKENSFRAEHGLAGKFVVMYAGNLGHTSALEEVMNTAEILRDHSQVRFVIVGEGVKKGALEQAAQRSALENVTFLPFQPRQGFAEMLAAADVGLVTLNSSSAQTSLPSKIFNIMASGRPVLAVSPPDSEIARLISEGECGFNVPPGQPDLLAQVISAWEQQPGRLSEMGTRGRRQLEMIYSRARCVDMFERMLRETVGG